MNKKNTVRRGCNFCGAEVDAINKGPDYPSTEHESGIPSLKGTICEKSGTFTVKLELAFA